MSNVISFPTREKLGFSAAVSPEVYSRSKRSYHEGHDAFYAGKPRQRPHCKSKCFDSESWLLGWDDAAKEQPDAA